MIVLAGASGSSIRRGVCGSFPLARGNPKVCPAKGDLGVDLPRRTHFPRRLKPMSSRYASASPMSVEMPNEPMLTWL